MVSPAGVISVSERPWINPDHAFWSVRNEPHLSFLDSAMRGFTQSRWSYLALDPLAELVVERLGSRVKERGGEWAGVGDWQAELRGRLANDRLSIPREAPPFVGGWIGWLGYELGPRFDCVAAHEEDLLGEPLAHFCFYDAVDCFDSGERRRWRVTLGDSASHALDELVAASIPAPLPASPPEFQSSLDGGRYRAAVREAIERIVAGDIYQMNLARIITTRGQMDFPSTYLRLREASPAPYAAFLRTGDSALLSSSPELFIDFDASKAYAVSRPIKGTRPRGATHAEDVRLALELESSEKDRAENIMIVDLVRNDLGRVCETGSVRAGEICRREIHPTVFHLVSTVEGTVRPGVDTLGVLQALFPGGSVTGAPKIKATEIIRSLEPGPRGPYTGCYGYFSVSGDCRLAMSIRVLWMTPEAAAFGVGGAIVADSDPDEEYRETQAKGAAICRALGDRNA